jgi:gas vesicle protein
MKSSKNILMGLAAFFTAGLVVGVLYAPEKGEKTRKKISRKKKNLMHTAGNKITDGRERIEDWKGNMMNKIETLSEEVRGILQKA